MARSAPPGPQRELGGYPLRESTLTDLPAGPPPAAPPGRGRWRWIAGAGVLLLLAGVGAAYALTHRSSHRARAAQTTPTVAQSAPAATSPRPTVAKQKRPRPTPNPRVVVPRLVGQTAQQAVATLRALGLTATSSTVRSTKPTGTVVGQDPRSGTKLKRGKAVHLELAAGPPHASAPSTTAQAPPPPPPAPPALVSVPDVRGDSLGGARAAIRRAGLVTEMHSVPSHEPKGTVVAQSPTAGQRVKRQSHVLVNVSQGAPTPPPPPPPPAPAPQQTAGKVSVPSVVGQEAAVALAALQQAGFTVNEVDSPTNDQSQDGLVVSEQPAGGSQTASGSTVTISIGRYSATG